MESRQLINGVFLVALCIVCGCKTPTVAESLLHGLGGKPLNGEKAWDLQQYCDPQRYTYHQTCWRPMAYEPCDWGPGSHTGCLEQGQLLTPREILEGPPNGQRIDPEAPPVDQIPGPDPSIPLPPPGAQPRPQNDAPPAVAPPAQSGVTYWLSPPASSHPPLLPFKP